jgi:hypothetical protein
VLGAVAADLHVGDLAGGVAEHRQGPHGTADIGAAAVAGEPVAGLADRAVRVGAAVEHAHHALEGTQADRVHEEVDVTCARTVLVEVVVECPAEAVSVVEQLPALTPPQGVQALVQFHESPQ